jgi:hypothetical protein
LPHENDALAGRIIKQDDRAIAGIENLSRVRLGFTVRSLAFERDLFEKVTGS